MADPKPRACLYCGTTDQVGVDHLVPRSRGGGEGLNRVPCCWKCNSKKGAKTPSEWLGATCPPAVLRLERRIIELRTQFPTRAKVEKTVAIALTQEEVDFLETLRAELYGTERVGRAALLRIVLTRYRKVFDRRLRQRDLVRKARDAVDAMFPHPPGGS